jgi:hypothetical protein
MRRALPSCLLALTLLLVAAGQALAQGCAMCGNSFAPDDPATNAINTSIAFLLLAPYTLLAGVAAWLYVRHRRAGSVRRTTVVSLPWVRGAHAAIHEED